MNSYLFFLLKIIFITETGVPRRGDELLQADGTAFVGACCHDRQVLINKEMPVVKVASLQDNAGNLGLTSTTSDSLVCKLFLFV